MSLLAEAEAEGHRVPQNQEAAEAAGLTLQGDQGVEAGGLQVQQNQVQGGVEAVLKGHHDPVGVEGGQLQAPRSLVEVEERQVLWEAEGDVLLR